MSDFSWPAELRINADRNCLAVHYPDGTVEPLDAEYLRVFTPSAERTGHGGRRTVIGGKAKVRIDAVAPIGRYAVRISFDDGHSTGIYPLTSLHTLAAEHGANWAQYEAELAALGLDRDRPGSAPAPLNKTSAALSD
ncbi:DUF971 domain-containing protein [Acuticoccus sp. MNP-M23]|uniref:DUF971 domain-containing protein n=1 Tax=Acuticoccus sp. MNP-M23 TaxID=3072793 RepID=UPI002815B925|nr:DUF971 domain-containing protein [Acuticoccus sp. MNP-M23]WMS42251.1 DUF971 domain-containing protein [Acuticoccus sp. MNP-M23]